MSRVCGVTSITVKSLSCPDPTWRNRHSPCDAHPCGAPYVVRTNCANAAPSIPVIPPSIAIWNVINRPDRPITAALPGRTLYERDPAIG